MNSRTLLFASLADSAQSDTRLDRMSIKERHPDYSKYREEKTKPKWKSNLSPSQKKAKAKRRKKNRKS